MIFVKSTVGGALFVMLTEKDIVTLRQGHTLFVDQRQLQGATFEQAILSLHKSNEEAVALLKTAGGDISKLTHAEPKANQLVCPGCQGVIDTVTMFEGQCIVCWASQAKKLKIQSN